MGKLIKKLINTVVTIVLLVAIVGAVFVAYKLYNHEKNQQNQIISLTREVSYLKEKLIQTADYQEVKEQQSRVDSLSGEVDSMKQKLKQVVDYYEFQNKSSGESYDYLAIGNSLTLIPSWGRGICSTEPDNDYFNLVVKRLKELNNKVEAHPINYAPWERHPERDKAFELLDPYLNAELDLVTIQLGENAADTSTYEKDLESLVAHIRSIAPKATILMIGDFWDLNRNEMRKTAAKNTGIPFADLAEIVGDRKYQSVAGLECNVADGSKIIVPEVAATHPGDLGMQYIADKVCEALKINK